MGHPTYAVTIVILAMLLFSGLGSIASGWIPEARRQRALALVLVGVIVLGALQALVVPSLLKALFLGQPVALRIGITFVVLAPLGFLMGLPFPLAMAQLPERASGAVAWAWALNGWMSVVASLVTVVVSRLFGYSYAFGLALLAYAIAVALVPRLAGREIVPHAKAAAG